MDDKPYPEGKFITRRRDSSMREDNKFPQIVSMANVCGDIYYKAYNYPGTFVLKEGDSKPSVINEMTPPYEWKKGMFSDVVAYEDKLVFLPYFFADYLAILDINTLTFSYLENVGKKIFNRGIVSENYIYMFGTLVNGGHVAKLNMDTMEIENVKFKNQRYKQKIQYGNIAVIGKKIYCPFAGEEVICCFDLESGYEYGYKIKNFDLADSVNTITYDGEFFWISTSSNKIYVWDEGNDCIVDIIELDDFRRKYPWTFWFAASKKMGDYVYFSPAYYNTMIRVNIYSHEVEKLFEISDEEVCWNICSLDEGNLFVDITEYNSDYARNYVLNKDGTIVANDPRFSLDGLYFQSNINEDRFNGIKGFLNWVVQK